MREAQGKRVNDKDKEGDTKSRHHRSTDNTRPADKCWL